MPFLAVAAGTIKYFVSRIKYRLSAIRCKNHMDVKAEAEEDSGFNDLGSDGDTLPLVEVHESGKQGKPASSLACYAGLCLVDWLIHFPLHFQIYLQYGGTV